LAAPLENFDDIVGDAFRKTRFNRPAHFDLGTNSNDVANASLDANDVEA